MVKKTLSSIFIFLLLIISIHTAQAGMDIQEVGSNYVCTFLPDYDIHYIDYFQWTLNGDTVLWTDSRDIGSVLPIATESSTLTGVTLNPGDTLKCEVVYALTAPFAGAVDPLTDYVTLTIDSNNPPQPNTDVTISPYPAYVTTNELTCVANGLPIQSQGFQWYDKNNVAIIGATSQTLSASDVGFFEIGDTYKCEVTNLLAYPNPYLFGSALVSIVTNPNADAPTASIITPSTGDSTKIGNLISFTAIATGIAPLTYSWSSSIDGTLSTQKDFDTTTLSVGTHTITFTVTDNNGQTAQDSITISVNAAQAPTVSITSPENNDEFFEGENIMFNVDITDLDSSIASIVWSSNIDGIITSGNNQASFTSTLSRGTHTVTVLVTDSDGLTASDTVTFEVVAVGSPKVSVVFPNDGDVFEESDSIPFIGDGTRDLITNWEWSSNRDGFLSNNQIFETSTLSAGVHKITLRATDIFGTIHEVEYEIEILVNLQNFKATSIVSPNDFDHFMAGQNIILSGLVDNQDTTDSLIWSSDIDGTLGSGNSINVGTLSTGMHKITFSAVSSSGQISRDYINIYIDNTTDPTASIIHPVNYVTFRQNNQIFFSGVYTSVDPTSTFWSSDVDGTLSTSSNFDTTNLTRGKHTISFRVIDTRGSNIDKTTIYVLDQNAPSSSIISPLDNEQFVDGENILFNTSTTNVVRGIWISDIQGIISTSLEFTTSTLAVGEHVITFIGFDASGEYTLSRILVTVTESNAPTVQIISPTNGQTFVEHQEIEFEANATGNITQWQWSSDIDGVFGYSKIFNYSGLSLGRHDITVTVIDDSGNRYSATHTIWIIINTNTAPIVTIDMPDNGDIFNTSTDISFEGTVTTSLGRTVNSYSWVSSIDGLLSTTEDFSLQLNPGVHTIIFTAIDSAGEVGTDSIIITVQNSTHNNSNGPSVTINNPLTGDIYNVSNVINFESTVIVAAGRSVTSYSWISSIDGLLSTTEDFNSQLTPGNHTIILTVMDSAGEVGTDSVTIQVVNGSNNNSNNNGSMIIRPNDGQVFAYQSNITFEANTTSSCTNLPIVTYQWLSTLDGFLSSSNTFVSKLSSGTHNIVLVAYDTNNTVCSESITIYVNNQNNGNMPPIAVANGPYNAKVGETVQFSSLGSLDPDGTIVQYTWHLGKGAPSHSSNPSFVYDKAGTYQISLTVTDNDGAENTVITQVTIREDNSISDEKHFSSRESIYIDAIEMPNNGVFFTGETAQILVTFKNNLKTTVKDMRVTVLSQELSLYTQAGPFKVSRGDTVTKEMLLNIPSGVSPGEYYLRISVYDNDHTRIMYVPIKIA